MEALKDFNITWTKSKVKRFDFDGLKSSVDCLPFVNSSGDEQKVALCVQSSSAKPLSVNVADEKLHSIRLYFVYTEGEDGTFPLDEEHTAFYGAIYTFEGRSASRDEVYYSLENKLCSLYGETEEIHYPSGLFVSGSRKCIWFGTKQTILSLFHYGTDRPELGYFWQGGDALAKETNDCLVKWNREHPGNTDGL